MIELLQYCDISDQLWFRFCRVVRIIKLLGIYPIPKQLLMLVSAIDIKSHYDFGYWWLVNSTVQSVAEKFTSHQLLKKKKNKKKSHSNWVKYSNFTSSAVFQHHCIYLFINFSLQDVPCIYLKLILNERVCSITPTSNAASSKIAKEQKLWISNGMKRVPQPLNLFCCWNFTNFSNTTQKH